MNWEQIHSVFFVGIGGIGMSALARYMNANGMQVGGYDKTSTELTLALENEHIFVTYNESIDSVPEQFKNKQHTLIIITPAVPANHHALQWYENNGFQIIKRAKALGLIANRNKLIAVAGTHGKTTTTGLVAHILTQSGVGCQAFLGGITKNYNTNLLLHPTSTWAVAEADEYDRSFLHLTPDYAIITSVDADHMDIYGSVEDINQTFNQFVAGMRKGAVLVVHADIRSKIQVPEGITCYTYSLDNTSADYRAENIKQEGLFYTFDVIAPGGKIYQNFSTSTLGIINVLNSLAAIAITILTGIKIEAIRTAVSTYIGNKRRFDILHQSENKILIDDYAHHPKEIEALGNSLNLMFHNKKITVVFQPHLYSRTRDFAKEFGEALSVFDEVYVTEIYPARELPIAGIDHNSILEHVKSKKKQFLPKTEIADYFMNTSFEILVTVGAGDIESTAKILVENLEKNMNKI